MTEKDYFNGYFEVEDNSYFDIPLTSDMVMYVDPHRLKVTREPLFDAKTAQLKVNNFFSTVFDLYREDSKELAVNYLSIPREINATHFGLSKGMAQGTGPSRDILHCFFEKVTNELEQSLLSRPVLIPLLVRNFGPDRFSDLIVNIISKELADFTYLICAKHGKETHEVEFCTYYDTHESGWKNLKAHLPIGPDGKPILLVPKDLAVNAYGFSAEQYVNQVVLKHLQAKHFEEMSPLVRYKERRGDLIPTPPTITTLRRFEIDEPYAEVQGKGKAFALNQSLTYPHLLEQYVTFVEGRTFVLEKGQN